MARVAVPLVLLAVLAVVVEGAPPEIRPQNHAVVSDLLAQLFQASLQYQETNQAPLVNLQSQETGREVVSGQSGHQSGQEVLTGVDNNGKSFDCRCDILSAWRDPFCAYLCQQAIIG
ncbi:uncharacterized protein LOC118425138 [Branchiostoma floridae]|uniref:Uncharacterized protein LOC118425138 n=1 Tax=Branchiostoma floridae TaxID=7739 RepID=A0A9J7LX78_BRAFL|nr:uncharacterized protein LOC118425138 [Branchiostoma floridae]